MALPLSGSEDEAASMSTGVHFVVTAAKPTAKDENIGEASNADDDMHLVLKTKKDRQSKVADKIPWDAQSDIFLLSLISGVG